MKRTCVILCLITVAGSQLCRLDAADPEILAHAIDSRLQARFDAEQINTCVDVLTMRSFSVA